MNEPEEYIRLRAEEEAELQPIRDAMDDDEYVMEQFDAYCDEPYYDDHGEYYPTDEELDEMARTYYTERMMA